LIPLFLNSPLEAAAVDPEPLETAPEGALTNFLNLGEEGVDISSLVSGLERKSTPTVGFELS
jgi:hypothetical protein